MIFRIALEQEADGRWLAEVTALPGVMAYGLTPTDATAVAELLNVTFQAA